MVFSSVTFLYFFVPILFIVYFLVPTKLKNLLILVSGLFFYAWGEPVYVIIMVLSTAIDYTAGRFIDKYDDNQKKRTAFLLVSVIMNVGLLAVFKYSPFFVQVINDIFSLELNPKLPPLPIGISFYTFQSMSYTIDLYLRHIKVQKNFISFTSYVSLFPQIVAGPIVRYSDVAAEIDDRKVNVSLVSEGIGKFLKGLAKKIIIANNIGMVWTTVKAMEYSELSVLTAWIGILAFTFQIYFDFSGYSDMAVGLGKMLGFNFPMNFDHPYMSKSISEFWRRWHITLGNWFKSYVYIPLGGNRGGLGKTIRNLLIVWGLTGLWHGASWNFLLWGVYFGVLIILERLFLGKILEKLPSAISMFYTFFCVVLGWVMFDVETLSGVFSYFGAMFGAGASLFDETGKYLLFTNLLIFAICVFGSADYTNILTKRLEQKNKYFYMVLQPIVQVSILVLCTAFLVDSTYNPFLYFRF